MSTPSTTQSLEQEIVVLEMEFKKTTRNGLLLGLLAFSGLCLTFFTLKLIMDDGNFIPAIIGLLIGITSLVFVLKFRKKFDELKRQLDAKRSELAKMNQES